MPSVVATWGGTCNDTDTQEELIHYLRVFANECRQRLEAPVPKRPPMLEKMVELESDSRPDVPLIIEYDGPIEGKILVNPSLTARPADDQVELTRLGVPWISAGEDAGEAGFFGLSSAFLRGLDFRIYDPRGIYPLEDRIGFVFLRCPEFPALDGPIAEVADRRSIHVFANEVVRTADWFVATPSIHLRYYLEEWFDRLFAWIKYFFVPDFTYWRYDDLPGYEAASALFTETIRGDTRERTKQRAFELLMEWFNRDADDWTSRMASW